MHQIPRLLTEQKLSDGQAARILGLSATTVARYRRLAGIPPLYGPTSLEAKYAKYAVPLDGGCVGWTGRTGHTGVPVIRHRSKDVPAAHVAFRTRTGRDPVGQVKPECGTRHCVSGLHVLDTPGRTEWRLTLRESCGLERPWDECYQGHPWKLYGRIKADLSLYCSLCTTSHDRRKEDA